MNVLIAGSAGFLGHHLVETLLKRGDTVHGVDNFTTSTGEKTKELVKKHKTFTFNRMDALGLSSVERYEVVYNCAAQPRMEHVRKHPQETLKANVGLVAHVGGLCKRDGVPLVHCSSSSVYGFSHTAVERPICEYDLKVPANTYGIQKLLAESILYDLKPEAILLRFFNVYGPGQPDDSPYTGVITKFLKQKQDGVPLTIFGDGTQERDFTFVDDAVNALVNAGERLANVRNIGVRAYNIGSGKSWSVKEIAEAIGGEITFQPRREGDVKKTCADVTLAENEIFLNLSDMTPIRWVKSL